jgi:hypothetical protein
MLVGRSPKKRNTIDKLVAPNRDSQNKAQLLPYKPACESKGVSLVYCGFIIGATRGISPAARVPYNFGHNDIRGR